MYLYIYIFLYIYNFEQVSRFLPIFATFQNYYFLNRLTDVSFLNQLSTLLCMCVGGTTCTTRSFFFPAKRATITNTVNNVAVLHPPRLDAKSYSLLPISSHRPYHRWGALEPWCLFLDINKTS